MFDIPEKVRPGHPDGPSEDWRYRLRDRWLVQVNPDGEHGPEVPECIALRCPDADRRYQVQTAWRWIGTTPR